MDGTMDLTFRSHDEAVNRLEDLLAPHFETVHEVRMTGLEDHDRPYRIDLIGRCRDENGWVVGFEVKKAFRFMKEYAAALKQAADYRNATIDDPDNAPDLQGQRLAAIMVFPRWNGMHDNEIREYSKEAVGMEILAAKFRVGACGIIGPRERVMFMLGLNRLWCSGMGWTSNAYNVLFGKRQIGGSRAKERRTQIGQTTSRAVVSSSG